MHSGFKSIVISPPLPQSLGSVVKLKLFFEVKVLMLKKKKKAVTSNSVTLDNNQGNLLCNPHLITLCL